MVNSHSTHRSRYFSGSLSLSSHSLDHWLHPTFRSLRLEQSAADMYMPYWKVVPPESSNRVHRWVSIGLGRLWEWASLRTIRKLASEKQITASANIESYCSYSCVGGSGERLVAVGSAEVSKVLCMNIDVRTEPCPCMY